ncbi:MAG: HAD-IIA family hydrolase [Acidimicrobiales bacterium]
MGEKTAVIVDLDGVVWRSDEPIHGASHAISRLRDEGEHVAFFTNNSFVTTGELLSKLARQDIDAPDSDVLSSAKAAATLVQEGERVLVVGGPGCVEALEAKGAIAFRSDGEGGRERFDAVVVGLDPAFTYRRLAQAQAAVRAGARLIGTNSDATYPTADGEIPGGGSILAAVEVASGAAAIIAGKPHEPSVALARERLGKIDLVVGDRPSTDGSFARALGARFGLVHTGVSPEKSAGGEFNPDYDAEDLAALVDRWIDRRDEQPI